MINTCDVEVSVIVAAYNQWRHLRALLDCLRGQRGCNFEVLICDDGSSADMLAEVRQCDGLDIRYLWQPDAGFRLARSRNNGVRCARGRVLLFVDADEVFGPDFVAQHAAMHPHGERRLISGCRRPAEVVGAEADIDVAALWNEMEHWPPSPEAQWVRNWTQRPSNWMGIIGGNFSATRSDAVVFDEDFIGWGYEDSELGYRLVAHHGYKLSFAPDIVAVHLYWNGESPTENPIATGRPDAADELLQRALLFARKHPEMDVEATIPALRFMALDEATGHWTWDDGREPRPVCQVLDEIERFAHQTRQASR